VACDQPACRLRPDGTWAIRGTRTVIGLQILQPHFQLFDLPIDLLWLTAKLHTLQLGNSQLQMLDLERPVRKSLL
jgi:hypothetical protein